MPQPIKNVLLILLLLTLNGCLSKFELDHDYTQHPQYPFFAIGEIPPLNGYYILLGKTGDNWNILRIQKEQIKNRENSNQEVLVIDDDLKVIAPNFNAKGNQSCRDNDGLLFRHKKVITTTYNSLCDTKFVRLVDSNCVPKNTCDFILNVFNLNKHEIMEIVIKTDLINRVKDFKVKHEYGIYLQDFNNSEKNLEMLKNFTIKYQGNDPDRLIPKALDIIPMLEKQKAKDRERQKIAERNQIQANDIARKNKLNNFKIFRKSLKIGSETNCGPLLEIKGELIKVYFPVMDYGNEHWLRIDQIYPPHNACIFVNGKYQP